MIEQIKEIVGESNVSEDPLTLQAYSFDGSMTESKNPPKLVVWPGDKVQIREIVEYCKKVNLHIIPRGSGTNTAGMCISGYNSIILDFKRMNKIITVLNYVIF